MKKVFLLVAGLSIAIASNAQLKVDTAGHVSIATTLSNLKPKLAVGNDCINDVCIGVSAAPTVEYNKSNVGVYGRVIANQSYTLDKNYGVCGVCSVNKLWNIKTLFISKTNR